MNLVLDPSRASFINTNEELLLAKNKKDPHLVRERSSCYLLRSFISRGPSLCAIYSSWVRRKVDSTVGVGAFKDGFFDVAERPILSVSPGLS